MSKNKNNMLFINSPEIEVRNQHFPQTSKHRTINRHTHTSTNNVYGNKNTLTKTYKLPDCPLLRSAGDKRKQYT